MTLPLDPKIAKMRLIYSRDIEKRQALRTYIRSLGYCPDCKLPLRECKTHEQEPDRSGYLLYLDRKAVRS